MSSSCVSLPISFVALLSLIVAPVCLPTTVLVLTYSYQNPMPRTLQCYLEFAYNSFLKPHSGDSSGNQQEALESFYEHQADAYDITRTTLLRGRDVMVQLVAAQLMHKSSEERPVWVDIGGGTGWNIEQMGRHVDVPTFFSAIFLVDLAPSLLKVAEARFEKLGWRNVKVICLDCRYFDLQNYKSSAGADYKGADLVTMSYSLTMIPDFFPVIDMTTRLLAPMGIISVVDLYAQAEVEFMRRDYVGGFLNRHCTWLNRTFWRTWFEQDRVMFDGGRRDYLEYRFGTRLSMNKRNAMLPGLRIPFYIWIGCLKQNSNPHLDVSAVRTSFLPAPKGLVRPDIPLPSAWYQNRSWRTYYQDELDHLKQKGPTPMTLTAEEVSQLSALTLTSYDVILAPTGSGDLLLLYLLHKHKAIHAVDPDPLNNHLLELKLAAFQTLDRNELHDLFGAQTNIGFRNVLIDKLSPHLSSHALQHWLSCASRSWLAGSIPSPILLHPSTIELNKFATLSTQNALDRLRIHTASMKDVLSRVTPGSLTLVVVGDSWDYSPNELEAYTISLNKALARSGRVILKAIEDSIRAVSTFQKLGFGVERYASNFLLCTKTWDSY